MPRRPDFPQRLLSGVVHCHWHAPESGLLRPRPARARASALHPGGYTTTRHNPRRPLRPTWRQGLCKHQPWQTFRWRRGSGRLVDLLGKMRALQPAWVRHAQSILRSARPERAKGGPDGSGPLGRRRVWPPKRSLRSARGFDQSCGVVAAPATAPCRHPRQRQHAAPEAHPIGSVTRHPKAAPIPAPVAPPAKARAPGSSCQVPSRV